MTNIPSRILLGVFAVGVAMCIAFTYWDTMIVENFTVLDDVEEETEEESPSEFLLESEEEPHVDEESVETL